MIFIGHRSACGHFGGLHDRRLVWSLLPLHDFGWLIYRVRYVFPADVLRRISSRITNEVNGVNRVTYDISSKPPGVSSPLVDDTYFFTEPWCRRSSGYSITRFCIWIADGDSQKGTIRAPCNIMKAE